MMGDMAVRLRAESIPVAERDERIAHDVGGEEIRHAGPSPGL